MGTDKKSRRGIQARQLLLLVLTFFLVTPFAVGQSRSRNPNAGSAFVQENYATPQGTESSAAVPYAKAQTAGDTNIVAIGWNSSSSTVSSVTDSEGNSYQVAVPLTAGGGLSQTIYYAANINAAGAGSNVVTVRFSASVPSVDIRALEYGGLAAASPFDAGASASGGSSAANSGSARTTSANDLIFGAGMTVSTFQAAGSSFTKRVITSPDGDIAEDEMVSTTGSYAATASLSAGAWLMQVAAFRTASNAQNSPTLPTISSFSASPSQIVVGSSTTLSWNVANASSITITPGSFSTAAAAGSTKMSPTSTTVYTLSATNAGGTTTATTSVYVDTTPPSVPASLTASATGTSTISLTWAPSTDGSGLGVAGYNIYRCTGASCTPSTLIGTSTTASYGDSGLAASTAYTYAVAAYDTFGLASGKSSPAHATTQNASLPTISSFAANPASIFSGQSSTLSWSVVNSTSLSISSGVGSVTNTTSTVVKPTATTAYTLSATNSNGTTTAKATVTVSPDSTPPSTPTGLTATASSFSTMSITWASSTDTGGPGLSGYNIYRCAGASCTPSTLVGTSTTASYGDSGLAASTTYTYAVAAYDTLGLASAKSSPAGATTQSNSAPTINSFAANPTSIFAGQSSKLSWSVANATSLSVSGVGTVTNTTSTSVSPAASTTYTLTASNTNGATTAQAAITVSPDSTPPSAPTGLRASSSGSLAISLTWVSSNDVGGPGVAGYNIYRCTGESCTPSTMVGTSTTASYTDTGLTASASYTYTVAAYDTLGLTSGPSSAASATTEVASVSPVPFAAYSSGTDTARYQSPAAAITNPSLIMYPKTPGGTIGGSNNCLLVPIYSAVGLTQTAPTDNKSDTYTEGPTVTSSGRITLTLWYLLGPPTGITTITEAATGTPSGTGNEPITSLGGWIVEVANCGSSVGGSGTLNAAATGSALTLTLSSAPSSGDLPIGFFVDASVAATDDSYFPITQLTSLSPGTGYTARTSSLTFGKLAEYSTTSTSTAMQFTPSGSDTWLGVGIDVQSGSAGDIPSGAFVDTWQEEQFPSASSETFNFPCMGNTIAVGMTTGPQCFSSITGSTGTWNYGVCSTTGGQTGAQIAFATSASCSSTTTVTPHFSSAAISPGITTTLISMSNTAGLDSGAVTSLDACSSSGGLVSCSGASGSTETISLVGITPSAPNEIVLALGSQDQHTANAISTDANGHTPQPGYAVDPKTDDAQDTCDGSTPPNTLSEDNPFGLFYNTDTLAETFIFAGTWVSAGGLGSCLNDPTGAQSWTAVGVAFN
jgi:hypothetical protein